TGEKRQAVIAGALQRERDLLSRASFEVVQRQRQRLPDQTTDLQAPGGGIENGLVIVPNGEELVVGSKPAVQRFPLKLGLDHVRNRVSRRLVQPGEDLFAGLSRERVGEAGCPQQGQAGDSRTPLQQDVSTGQMWGTHRSAPFIQAASAEGCSGTPVAAAV